MEKMEDKITIKKEDILNAYNQAPKGQKSLLENIFGKDMFQQKDFKERVKTFEDACSELGYDHPLVKSYDGYVSHIHQHDRDDRDVVAYLKLRIICEALNDGWKPTFNENECRYYTWFHAYNREKYDELNEDQKKLLRFVVILNNCVGKFATVLATGTAHMPSYPDAYFGSRLAFKTSELATYAGTQFFDIWCDFLFK